MQINNDIFFFFQSMSLYLFYSLCMNFNNVYIYLVGLGGRIGRSPSLDTFAK